MGSTPCVTQKRTWEISQGLVPSGSSGVAQGVRRLGRTRRRHSAPRSSIACHPAIRGTRSSRKRAQLMMPTNSSDFEALLVLNSERALRGHCEHAGRRPGRTVRYWLLTMYLADLLDRVRWKGTWYYWPADRLNDLLQAGGASALRGKLASTPPFLSLVITW